MVGQGIEDTAEPWVLFQHRLRNIGQAHALADNDIFDVPFDDLGDSLGAAFRRGIAGGHTVADVEIVEQADREIDGFAALGEAAEGQGADSPSGRFGVVVAEMVETQLAVGVVQGAEPAVEQFGAVRPGDRHGLIAFRRKPFFVWIIKKRLFRLALVEKVLGEEEIGLETLEELAQGTGLAGQSRRPFAVGVEMGTGGGAQMHRPAVRCRILPAYRLGRKIEGFKQGGGLDDGIFEGGILAGNKSLWGHDMAQRKNG
ncbi:MAG: hypothetical protein ACD_75C01844G0001 [uncultured bacterium]|nr:MAG: hypothetical protein ACD_75C01844G0001 [uncultured bacterium]